MKRAPGIVAGIALGLVAPIAFASYAFFTRPPADVVSKSADPSYVPIAIAAVVFAAIGWALVASRSRFGAGVRSAIAWGAVLGGTTIFAFAAGRADDVDRDRFLRDMPVVGEVVETRGPMAVGAITVELLRSESIAASDSGADAWGRSFSCQAIVSSPGKPNTLLAVGEYGGCRRVRVRHDANNEIVVIEHVPLWAAPSSEYWQRLAVLSSRDGSPMSPDARAFRRSLAVPREWASTAAFATALGLTFLLVALSARRRARKFAALTDAVHVGEGWFATPDGRRIHAAWAGELPLGDFSVRITEPTETPTYRDSAAARVEPIARGPATAHVAKARGLVATGEGVALTIAVLGTTPALVALISLLF
jgi:hypothetical protein